MTTTPQTDTRGIQLLMVGPLLPELIDDLATRYTLHRWWQIEDREAFLRAQGPAIRGIVTSGRFGASRELIESLPALEAITSFGVGYDPIDIDAARARGVIVTNTPGVLDDCVADTALALMLSVSRRIAEADRFVRAGRWPSASFGLGRKLGGQVCGIAGLGNIGRQVALRAEAFGMRVAYHNRRPRNDLPSHYVYHADLLSLARASDALVLTVPGSTQTRHIVGIEVLQALGDEGILVNVARGSVVDEAALVRALQERVIAGAGLDVFEHEPQVPQALLRMDNVTLLPHLASGTVETRKAMAELLLANLDGWFTKREVRTRVV